MAFINNFRRYHTGVIHKEQIVTFQFATTSGTVGTTAQFYPAVSDIVFTTSSSGGETIGVSATLPGGVTVTPKVYVVSTGLPATATALASGTYFIKQREFDQIYTLSFTKSAAVNQGIVSGAVIKQSYNA